MHTNGVGITIAAMRLSLLVPVLISVFLYAEYLNILKIAGIVLVFGSLVLLIPQKNSVKIGKYGRLMAIGNHLFTVGFCRCVPENL
ncbi:MAG: hypothetical protein U5J63_00980 [Fodinibius sp.]|nr:hypothetical protein [Fodinibius sp.]